MQLRLCLRMLSLIFGFLFAVSGGKGKFNLNLGDFRLSGKSGKSTRINIKKYKLNEK